MNEEEIRRKRLARFGVLEQLASAERSKANAASSQSPSPSHGASPVVMAEAKAPLPTPQSATHIPEPVPPPKPVIPADPAKVEDAVLSRIFSATLDESSLGKVDRVVYLKEMADEIRSTEERLLISRANIDRVLVDRMGLDMEPFEFLIQAFALQQDEERKVSSSSWKHAEMRSEITEVCRYAGHLIVSYIGLVISSPEAFISGRNVSAADLTKYLLDHILKETLPSGLIESLVSRFGEDEDNVLHDIFAPISISLSGLAAQSSLLKNDFVSPLKALVTLLGHKAIARMFTGLPAFLPSGLKVGFEIEQRTLLGPFFRPSALAEEPQVGQSYFRDASKMTMIEADSAKESLRASLKVNRYLLTPACLFLKDMMFLLLNFSRCFD